MSAEHIYASEELELVSPSPEQIQESLQREYNEWGRRLETVSLEQWNTYRDLHFEKAAFAKLRRRWCD